jgi:uncharacterized protein YgiM (DUF1202 family)
MLARLAAITVIAFAGLTAAASAAEVAYTKSAANLREGPGTSYDIITTLPKNSALLVQACTATWCAVITDDDDEGFIAKSLLKKNPSGPDIPFSIKIIIGPEGPFLDFGDIFIDEPQPKPSYPEVCFYQQANFKGANFCVEEGDEDNDIPGSFDNNIESILISGGLGVEVCSGVGHGGECFYYTKSQKTLPSQIRNKISSYVVDNGDSGFNDDDFDDDDDGGNIIILQ